MLPSSLHHIDQDHGPAPQIPPRSSKRSAYRPLKSSRVDATVCMVAKAKKEEERQGAVSPDQGTVRKRLDGVGGACAEWDRSAQSDGVAHNIPESGPGIASVGYQRPYGTLQNPLSVPSYEVGESTDDALIDETNSPPPSNDKPGESSSRNAREYRRSFFQLPTLLTAHPDVNECSETSSLRSILSGIESEGSDLHIPPPPAGLSFIPGVEAARFSNRGELDGLENVETVKDGERLSDDGDEVGERMRRVSALLVYPARVFHNEPEPRIRDVRIKTGAAELVSARENKAGRIAAQIATVEKVESEKEEESSGLVRQDSAGRMEKRGDRGGSVESVAVLRMPPAVAVRAGRERNAWGLKGRGRDCRVEGTSMR